LEPNDLEVSSKNMVATTSRCRDLERRTKQLKCRFSTKGGAEDSKSKKKKGLNRDKVSKGKLEIQRLEGGQEEIKGPTVESRANSMRLPIKRRCKQIYFGY